MTEINICHLSLSIPSSAYLADMFQYLLSFSQGHLSSLLEGTYSSLSRQALPHVNQLFSSLSLYLRGANVSVEAAVHQFFNNLFPLVYTRLINPGIEGSMMVGSEMGDCLRMIRQDVNPFGPHPAVMAQELVGALGAGRQLGLALEEGVEVMNATEHVSLSKECVKGLVKMVYCSHCRGLTLIKPCVGYCLNVMRGCLAGVSELDHSWRRYTILLEQLTHAMAGHHSLELALLGVREHVNEALLYAQLHGPLITATVSTHWRNIDQLQWHMQKKTSKPFCLTSLFYKYTLAMLSVLIGRFCRLPVGYELFFPPMQQRSLHTVLMFSQY